MTCEDDAFLLFSHQFIYPLIPGKIGDSLAIVRLPSMQEGLRSKPARISDFSYLWSEFDYPLR